MPGPTTKQLVKAILGAFVGVQSEAQRNRDFAQSSPWPYLVAGLVALCGFVALLWIVVSLVVD